MNAFVKTTSGNFPNANFYYAWKGFNDLQYNVIKFEDNDINESFWYSCQRSTPVFAGVQTFERILDGLKVKYNPPGTYPEKLRDFLMRNVHESTLGQVRQQFAKTEIPVFVKPIKQKAFKGMYLKTFMTLIHISNASDDCPVYVSEPMKFLSEYRCYIHRGKIVSAKHYHGEWNFPPDKEVIEKAIKTFGNDAPVAYSLDFGVNDRYTTALIECNDATSLGNYGLPPITYAEMLVDRWNEITQ